MINHPNLYLATSNKVRTNFSPSPIHFEVKEEEEIEKNVAPGRK